MIPLNNDKDKTDDEFRTSMVEYIRTNFADVLGDDVKLLDLDGGLELIREKYMHIMRNNAA